MPISMIKTLSVIFLLALSMMNGPAAAQSATDVIVDTILDTVFTQEEKRIIDVYVRDQGGIPEKPGYEAEESEEAEESSGRKNKKNKHAKRGKGKGKGLPPGLAKRKELPPGLRRQLEKHRTLPPGLAVRELPDDLVSKLPEPPAGTDRIVVEDDVVLIEKATGRILDIILGRGTTN